MKRTTRQRLFIIGPASLAAMAAFVGLLVPRTSHLKCIQVLCGDERGFPATNSECSIAAGPRGKYVYATHSNRSAFVAFARDTTSGRLAPVQAFQKDLGESLVKGAVLHRDYEIGRGIAASPDGQNVYVGPCYDIALAVFRHEGATLRFVETVRHEGCDDGTLACVVSPDGRHVYAATNWGNLCVFRRDPDSDGLSFVQLLQDENVGALLPGTTTMRGRKVPDAITVEGMDTPRSLAFSPDGEHLYVAGNGSNSVAVFERDSATGELVQVQTVWHDENRMNFLVFPVGIAVSPDGEDVYVCTLSNRLVSFNRNPTSGKLGLHQTFQDNVNGVDGLSYARSVCVAPDGRRVYVAGCEDHAIAVFSRHVETGELTFLDVVRDKKRLHRVWQLAISPDGKNLYAVSKDSGIAVFAVKDAENR